MPTTTRLVSWTPQVVYEPVLAGHRKALALTVVATKAVTPRRTGRLAGSVRSFPTGEFTAIVGTRLYYGKFVAAGTKPHDETPRKRGRRGNPKKRALAAAGFGPVAAVHNPGVRATHFVEVGARAYPELFKAATAAEFVL